MVMDRVTAHRENPLVSKLLFLRRLIIYEKVRSLQSYLFRIQSQGFSGSLLITILPVRQTPNEHRQSPQGLAYEHQTIAAYFMQ
jgi:hypothetical protein